jgi:hypothetical protein
MSARFGFDFSAVRVHTDGEAARSAAAVRADAYTVGSHVVFGSGRFQPNTGSGMRLIAHELAHVVQQSALPATDGRPLQHQLEVSPSNSPAERSADAAADAVMRGAAVSGLAGSNVPSVQRAEVANCYSDTLTENQIGNAAHEVIQSWCAIQNAPCFSEVPIPGGSSKGTGNTGFADLLSHGAPGSGEIEVGEVKPVSQSGDVAPHLQLHGYITAQQALRPDVKVVPMYSWTPMPPLNGMTPFLPNSKGVQFLNCSAPTNGLYFYWCTRSKKDKDYKPYPIPLPKELLDRIQDTIKKLGDQGKGEPQKAPDKKPGEPGKRPEQTPEEPPVFEPEPAIPKWVWAAIAIACAIAIGILLLPAEIVAGILAAAAALVLLVVGSSDAKAATRAGDGDGGGRDVDAALAKLTSGQGVKLTPEQAARALALGQIVTDGVAGGAGGDAAKDLAQAAADVRPQLAVAQAALGTGGGSGPASPRSAGGAPAEGGGAKPTKTAPAQTGGGEGGEAKAPTSGGAPVLTPTAQLPEAGAVTSFPIFIVAGLGPSAVVGRSYETVLRIDLGSPFAVPVLLQVVSRKGRDLVLEVGRTWYVAERQIGSPKGTRYTYSF